MAGTLRRHVRVPLESLVQLSWPDEGGVVNSVTAKCLDISNSGMRVEIKVPIQNRSYVSFRLKGIDFDGTATVRSCVRKNLRYELGLEFLGGLRWEPRVEAAAIRDEAV